MVVRRNIKEVEKVQISVYTGENWSWYKMYIPGTNITSDGKHDDEAQRRSCTAKTNIHNKNYKHYVNHLNTETRNKETISQVLSLHVVTSTVCLINMVPH